MKFNGSEIIEECRSLRLDGLDFLESLGPEKIEQACNGIGPAWMKEDLREKITILFSEFLPPSHVHDCRHAFDNDGSKEKFHSANDEFERNCKKVYKSLAHWWQPKYWKLRSNARYLIKSVKWFGWIAYQQAYEEHKHD